MNNEKNNKNDENLEKLYLPLENNKYDNDINNINYNHINRDWNYINNKINNSISLGKLNVLDLNKYNQLKNLFLLNEQYLTDEEYIEELSELLGLKYKNDFN